MIRKIKFLIRALLCVFVFALHVNAQSFYGSTSPMVARFSSGWNYYSEGASLTPQLNEFTQYAMLNYRSFGDSGKITWQLRADIYQKDALTQTKTTNHNEQFDHRTVVRQAYGSYSSYGGEIKLGRFVPMGTHTDAFPINGAGFENLLIARHWRIAGYGGKIFDEYDNRPEGLGYSVGSSVAYESTVWSVGSGFSAERLRNTHLSKVYLFGEYRPTYNLRFTSNNQYVANKSLLGYSQNTAYYRFSRQLSARAFVEYHDRRAYFPTPTDSLSMDRFFKTSKEVLVGGSVRYQIFNFRKIGTLETTPSFKKRLGNDDLTYAALQLNYRNYFFWRFNTGLGFSYTENQWLKNLRTNFSLNRDFFDARLDASFSVVVNSYQWNSTSRSKNMTTISTDFNYRITSSWNAALGLYEEVGNASDPHTGVNVRMFYYLH